MLSCLTLSLALTLPAPVADDPKVVVEKAIKAHGGADLLNKFKAHRATFKGTVVAQGMEIEMKGESFGLLPDKFKVKATLMVAGQEVPLEQVINGKTFRMSIAGNEVPLPEEQVQEGVYGAYQLLLTQLTPLLTAEYTLTAAPEATVDGKKAVGVKVSHKDRPDVTLHFDAESGRLVQASRKGRAEDGSEAERVTVYGDHKAVKGMQVPHKETVTVGGQKTAVIVSEKHEPLETLDAGEFAAN